MNQFKYLGAILSEEGSETKVLARATQAAAALAKLKAKWRDINIRLSTKLKLLHAFVLSVRSYSCETWTPTAERQRKTQAVELRCLRTVLRISYTKHITNEAVRATITKHMKPYKELLTTVKKRKLQWYGHVTRATGLSNTVLQGTVQGGRRRGRQRKKWTDSISE